MCVFLFCLMLWQICLESVDCHKGPQADTWRVDPLGPPGNALVYGVNCCRRSLFPSMSDVSTHHMCIIHVDDSNSCCRYLQLSQINKPKKNFDLMMPHRPEANIWVGKRHMKLILHAHPSPSSFQKNEITVFILTSVASACLFQSACYRGGRRGSGGWSSWLWYTFWAGTLAAC